MTKQIYFKMMMKVASMCLAIDDDNYHKMKPYMDDLQLMIGQEYQKGVEGMVEDICDNYCKYPDQGCKYTETYCEECPLNKLLTDNS